MDGGFVNKIPIEICRARGAGFVVAVSVSPQDSKLEDSFPDVCCCWGMKILFCYLLFLFFKSVVRTINLNILVGRF